MHYVSLFSVSVSLALDSYSTNDADRARFRYTERGNVSSFRGGSHGTVCEVVFNALNNTATSVQLFNWTKFTQVYIFGIERKGDTRSMNDEWKGETKYKTKSNLFRRSVDKLFLRR